MQVLQTMFQAILDLDATVFMPIIILILGLIMRMKWKDILHSALYIGIAFIAVNMVVNYLYEVMSPPLEAFAENTGKQLIAIDLGWTAVSTVAWSWPYVFLMFPIQIGINMLLLAIKKTDVLNVDMWNVWQKGFIAAVVYGLSGSLIFGIAVGAIGCVCELYIGEVVQPEIKKICGADNVTCPHWCLLLCAPMYAVDSLLRKIPFLNKSWDLSGLKEKLGIFSEAHIIGFIIGTIVALVGGTPLAGSILIGIQLAACLVLLPRAAKIFMTALAPFSEAAESFMRKRFPGRDFIIGLDWPIMAGSQELWITCIILVPVFIGLALAVPGNIMMPLAGIMCATLMSPAVLVTGGNILRCLILGVIFMVPNLLISSWFAGPISDLAVKYAGYELPAGQLITRNLEGPIFDFGWAYLADGHLLGILVVVFYLGSLFFYVRNYRKERKAAAVE